MAVSAHCLLKKCRLPASAEAGTCTEMWCDCACHDGPVEEDERPMRHLETMADASRARAELEDRTGSEECPHEGCSQQIPKRGGGRASHMRTHSPRPPIMLPPPGPSPRPNVATPRGPIDATTRRPPTEQTRDFILNPILEDLMAPEPILRHDSPPEETAVAVGAEAPDAAILEARRILVERFDASLSEEQQRMMSAITSLDQLLP